MSDRTTAPRATDADLLARYSRTGDQAAFAELARRHAPLIAGVCGRVLGQPPTSADAEDAAQATLLVLAQKAPSVRDPSRLSAWLHGVALRHAKRLRTARIRRRRREGPFAAEPAVEAEPDGDWSEVRAVIDSEVSRLPAKLRAAFVLCELRGVSRADAAAQLAVDDGTLSSRLARAKEQLRARLTRRGVTVAGGTLAGLFEAGAAGAGQVGSVGLGRFPSQAAMDLASKEPSMLTLSWPVKLVVSALAVALLTWAGLAMLADPPPKPAPVAGANVLKNAGAEEGDKTPRHWEPGAEIDGVEYVWDRKAGQKGKASLCLNKTAKRYFPIAQWSQTVDRSGDLPALRVSAQVKAERATKAVLDVAFLDADGERVSHEWAAYVGAKEAGDPPADHDWKEYAGRVEIPKGAKRIQIALQIYGPGKVWFDEVRAEYVK